MTVGTTYAIILPLLQHMLGKLMPPTLCFYAMAFLFQPVIPMLYATAT